MLTSSRQVRVYCHVTTKRQIHKHPHGAASKPSEVNIHVTPSEPHAHTCSNPVTGWHWVALRVRPQQGGDWVLVWSAIIKLETVGLKSSPKPAVSF